ncbi:DUF4249 domain-containing protein [Marinilabiliaceae bacterium JC017]|nr:DUF4249 domain-containing protein [Marinilabiliaceae bacterium JC017]
MKVRLKNILIFCVTLLILFVGCEKDISLDIEDVDGKLVLYSFIFPDSSFSFHMSKSIGILSLENYKKVEDGWFSIYKNDQVQGTYFFPKDTIWGKWDYLKFHEGDTVYLEATDHFNDTANVATVIPRVVAMEKFDTISSVALTSDGIYEKGLDCKLVFSDPVNEKDFYQLVVVQERWEDVSGCVTYYQKSVDFISEDPVFYQRGQDGSLLEGADFEGLFNDYLINGKTYELKFRIPRSCYQLFWYDKKIKLSVYLYHITEDYYDYIRTKVLADFNTDMPVFEPVKIHSNVNNGIGLVTGLSFSNDSIIFKPLNTK